MSDFVQINLSVTQGNSVAAHKNEQAYSFTGVIKGGHPNLESVIEELRQLMIHWLTGLMKYDQVRIEIEDHVYPI